MKNAYQRLVKTTPKPRATKKSSGELDPLPPLLLFESGGVPLAEPGAGEVVGAVLFILMDEMSLHSQLPVSSILAIQLHGVGFETTRWRRVRAAGWRGSSMRTSVFKRK
jgi:hypothetical protein